MAEYVKSMPVREDAPLEIEEKSQLIGTSGVQITFSQDIMAFEIANNSDSATIYLDVSGTVAVLSKGIPIYPKGYYSAEKKILQSNGISLISTIINTDVRIIGHFFFDSEK
jgi:hypothetical protein